MFKLQNQENQFWEAPRSAEKLDDVFLAESFTAARQVLDASSLNK